MMRMLAALALTLVLTGLAWADDPQVGRQVPVFLFTAPVSGPAVGCYLTAVRNTTVTVDIVNGSASTRLLNQQSLTAGRSLDLFPATPLDFAYCKFTVHVGGRNAIRGAVCAFDGFSCLATNEAR